MSWKQVMELVSLGWYLTKRGYATYLNLEEPDNFWLDVRIPKGGLLFDIQVEKGPEGGFIVGFVDVYKEGEKVYSEPLNEEYEEDNQGMLEVLNEIVEDIFKELTKKGEINTE